MSLDTSRYLMLYELKVHLKSPIAFPIKSPILYMRLIKRIFQPEVREVTTSKAMLGYKRKVMTKLSIINKGYGLTSKKVS